MDSSMLLVWDKRVLCQPHCGHARRSGLVTSSTSSSSISSSRLSKSSYSDSLSGSLANFHAQICEGTILSTVLQVGTPKSCPGS
jgi:hypothetical protein